MQTASQSVSLQGRSLFFDPSVLGLYESMPCNSEQDLEGVTVMLHAALIWNKCITELLTPSSSACRAMFLLCGKGTDMRKYNTLLALSAGTGGGRWVSVRHGQWHVFSWVTGCFWHLTGRVAQKSFAGAVLLPHCLLLGLNYLAYALAIQFQAVNTSTNTASSRKSFQCVNIVL